MSLEKKLTLDPAELGYDPKSLVDGEWDELPFATEGAEAVSLDAEPDSEPFDLRSRRPYVPGYVPSVDAGRVPVIHNAFWVPGTVPSLNELLDAKSRTQPLLRSIIMRQKPKKGQRGARFDVYNELKQDWKHRTIAAIGTPFVRCASAYFGYLIVESSHRRDPSNICSAAVKFIEDGLVEAGVIPNDGWAQVLGIRVHWVFRIGTPPGVYVVMSDKRLSEEDLVIEYEDYLLRVL